MNEATNMLIEELGKARALLQQAVDHRLIDPREAGEAGLYEGIGPDFSSLLEPYGDDPDTTICLLEAGGDEYTQQLVDRVRGLSNVLRDPNGGVVEWYNELSGLRLQVSDQIILTGRYQGIANVPESAVHRLEQSVTSERKSKEHEASLRGLLEEITAARRKAQESAEGARQALSTAKAALGETGAVALGTHFLEVADSEGSRADTWRKLSIGSLVALGVAAAVGLVAIPLDDGVDLLRRALVGLPLLALSGYMVREASAHRRASRQYRLAAVQLRTIAAYEAAMPEVAQTELRLGLGLRVFGHDITNGGSTEPHLSIPGEVAALLQRSSTPNTN